MCAKSLVLDYDYIYQSLVIEADLFWPFSHAILIELLSDLHIGETGWLKE